MLTISQDAYRAWREDLSTCIDANSQDVRAFPAMVSSKLRELDTQLVPVATAAATRDASTQLSTVTGMSYTSQILRRHLAERTARGLARDVGRLAALMTELCSGIGVLMDLAVVGSAVTTADPPGRADEGETCSATAEAEAEKLLGLLSRTTVTAICSTSKAYRQSMEKQVEDGQMPPGERAARQFLRKRLVKRCREAHAYLQEQRRKLERGSVHAAAAAGGGPAFLCWRCRQDGRQGYAYDPEQRQLSQAAGPPQCPPKVVKHHVH